MNTSLPSGGRAGALSKSRRMTDPDSNEDPAAVDAAISKVVVHRVKSPTFQISERIRQMIQNAELTPGMKLPPTRTLAEQLSVDPTAVHRSLAQLVKEGLLVRTPRVGTFVAEPPGELKRIAYYHRPLTAGHFGNFDRAVLIELAKIGHKRGFEVEVFSDTRPAEISEKEPAPDLLRHARTRWVQAVASSNVSPAQVKWFSSLPVPSVSLVNPTSVRPRTMAEMAVRQLAARGCRRIGMITPLRIWEDPAATAYELALFHGYVSTMEKLGLAWRSEWLAGIGPGGKSIREPDMATHGFTSFNRIWDASPEGERPDGMFIYPDLVTGGALMALAMRGVRVPDDLRLLLHSNAELPMFCPYSVDRMVSRAADAARVLFDRIQGQLGRRMNPVDDFPMVIVPHE